MLDEIYLRLLHELTPESVTAAADLDIERTISNYDASHQVRATYGQLISANYEFDPNTDIGMRYGALLQPNTLCDYTRALMTCKDLAEALDLINSLHYMQGTVFYLSAHIEQNGDASISLCYPFQASASECQRHFFGEVVVSYLTNLIRHAINQDITPKKILFDAPEPNYAYLHEESFRCERHYNQPLAMVFFDKSLVNQPFAHGNEILHSIFLKKCLDRVKKQEKTWQFGYRTSVQIIRNMPHYFNASDLADSMNLSMRGLQKKLTKYDTSFSKLSTYARLAMLKVSLLQKNMPLDITAEQLGFQTVSGLRRFFKAETGVSLTETYAASQGAAIEIMN